EDLARRDSVLDQALMVARGLARRSRAEPDSVAAARRWLALGRAPLAIPSRALFSLALPAAFARTDDALSRLASALTQFVEELETGLAQVADGDLTVGIPGRGADELGRLAEHFNAMTRILRDRAEEQGRFAAAGELLAGVAHEVNNPLMAIAAHAENRLADPAFEGEQRSEMTQILRQARRATKLLRGLLRFVRASEREVTNVNLNDVVRG